MPKFGSYIYCKIKPNPARGIYRAGNEDEESNIREWGKVSNENILERKLMKKQESEGDTSFGSKTFHWTW